MVGIEGIVVGIVVGKGVANGGSVTFGVEGVFVGFGRVGIWELGNGAKLGFGRLGFVGSVGKGLGDNGGIVGIVGFGKVGAVGIVGNWVEGKGGKPFGLGNVGIEGIGGLGSDGILGNANAGGGAAGVSKRWRAAKTPLLESDAKAMIIDRMKKHLGEAMVWWQDFMLYMGKYLWEFESIVGRTECLIGLFIERDWRRIDLRLSVTSTWVRWVVVARIVGKSLISSASFDCL